MSFLSEKFTVICAFLICLTIHEAAHGYTAYLLGDDTAKQEGRLSFNPLRHIDPIGFLCLIFLHFGWAKPVVCDTRNFKNRWIGMAIVAAAGPLSNFVLAFAAIFITAAISFANNSFCIALSGFLYITAWYSTMLGIFNAFPLPILDGFHIISPILPKALLKFIYEYWQYMFLVLIILIYSGILTPILSTAASAFIYWAYDLSASFISIFI